MHIRPFELSDEAQVIDLWRKCELVRPVNDPSRDIRRKLSVNPELFLVGTLNGKIIAAVMVGYEGHRGWINYLAVHPGHRLNGYGRQMMAEAEKRLRAVGCPKINLQVRANNRAVIDFYRRVGFDVDDVVSLGKRLEHDEQKL
ncbi:MAG TPA: GNAT family acetyltransferase [Candidatus Polarisedimenticolia bacterium]|nr:GNAT family acetyltransferase [Candidatus Polarisedimenticolia bacterium]